MYRHHEDASAGTEPNFALSAGSMHSIFPLPSQFPSPVFSLDPHVQNSPQHLQTPSHMITRQSPRSRLAQSQTFPPADPGQMPPPPPASASPPRSTVAPSTKSPSPFVPADRLMPSPSTVSDLDSISDAYVSFILYCNPQFPVDVDTSTLRTSFQAPPKSDHKEFDTYRLYELIALLDTKVIKTWGQLALDLGVEAPDMNKGQSVQKVQQYTVRLKRWMNAMHINAFFDFLLGKEHPYFLEIPPANEPYPDGGRDDVLPEGDLALRALDPTLRPKRGRRRNSVVEAEESEQRSAIPTSAMPQSGHPDSFSDPWTSASAVDPNSFHSWHDRPDVPQTAVTSTAPSHLRWRLHGQTRDATTPQPLTAHPSSGSMGEHIDAAFDAAGDRAPSSNPRKRRRNGPTVSSAWPSGNAPGSKPRGRPPANRSVQDGAFGTFPADPNQAKNNSHRQPTENTQQTDPGAQVPPPLIHRQSDGASRPHRLSLQVPQHTGGPVRLATPPRVLLNGGEATTSNSNNSSAHQTPLSTQPPANQQLPRHQPPAPSTQPAPGSRPIPGFAYEALKRVLTSDLLRANLQNRSHRLTSTECKLLAEAILTRLVVPRLDTESSRDDIARVTAASWLGVGGQLNVPLGAAAAVGGGTAANRAEAMLNGSVGGGKRIVATRFAFDEMEYEQVLAPGEPVPGDAQRVREVFDVSWSAVQGGCVGNFELKGLCLDEVEQEFEEDGHDLMLKRAIARAGILGEEAGENSWIRKSMREAGEGGSRGGGRRGEGGGDDGVDWKAKYMALEFGTRLAKGELERVRERMLETVLDAII